MSQPRFDLNNALMTMAVLGCCGIAFGLWGLLLPAGRTAFEGMAGTIPVASLFGGAGLLVLVFVLRIIWIRRE